MEMSVYWEIIWINCSYQLVPNMASLSSTDYTPLWPLLQITVELQDLNICNAWHIFPQLLFAVLGFLKSWVISVHVVLMPVFFFFSFFLINFGCCGFTPNNFQV